MLPIDGRSIGIALATTLALCFGVVWYPKAVMRLDGRATDNSALSFSDRQVAGGNSVVVDQAAALEADVLIPRTETFRLVTGPRLRHATSLTITYVESWYRYFLMPRRPASDARWILCYGCDKAELVNYHERWHDANGISIGLER